MFFYIEGINMDNKNSNGIFKKILEIFGFNKLSEEEKEFHRDANVRSTLYLAAITIILETLMIIRFVRKYVLTGIYNTFSLFMEKSASYWILLSTGIIMLVYSLLYLKNKIPRSKYMSTFLTMIFTGICMYFGWVVSASDYGKGRMIICFMTMVIYAACLLIWRPYISIIMLSAIGASYIWYLNNYVPNIDGDLNSVLEADRINYTIYFISLITVVISIYAQRHSEAKKSAKLIKSSVTDDLTGLSNIRGFARKAKEKLESTEKATLIYLFFNIENFKIYNNRVGYAGGNELLIKFSKLILDTFQGDIIARQADDHFVVLTSSDGFMDKITSIREKILAEIKSEMYLDIKVGAYRPAGETVDPRLEIDRARYAVNTISGQADRFFAEYDEKMDKSFKLRNHIINNVDKAVKEGYISVYYQPVVWSEDKKICGCEALARWIDPDFGFLSPGDFIPVLEEARKINKLDLCVYETVCRDLRRRLDNGEKIFPVSLNFSRLDFELMDAVEELEKLVKKYDIPRNYLHVEITESALTEDTLGLKKTMDKLHSLGYSIWLDDFGSGYSSLNVLKDFDFDVLKIDMVFLRNFAENGFEENTQNTKNIIISILNLADQLGMKTLTEGVENEEGVKFLTGAGCGRLQGYYYSKPVPFSDIYQMIESGKLILSDNVD